MSQEDVLKRAEECKELMDREVDASRKVLFKLVHDLWLALANECDSLNSDQVAQQVAAIAQIQTSVQGNGRLRQTPELPTESQAG